MFCFFLLLLLFSIADVRVESYHESSSSRDSSSSSCSDIEESNGLEYIEFNECANDNLNFQNSWICNTEGYF